MTRCPTRWSLVLCWCVVVAAAPLGVGCATFTGGSDKGLAWKSPLAGAKSKAPAVDPQALKLEITKGRGFEKTSDWEKARQHYQQVSRQFPQAWEPLHRLAVVSDQQGRRQEAQHLYRRAIAIDPTNAELYNDLGYSLFLEGKLTEAEPALRQAVALAPANSRFHNNLGMTLGQQGRYYEALVEFHQAGSEADAYYNLAFVYASQDRDDEAKECFRRALAVDPRHQNSLKALRSFEQYETDLARGRAPRDFDGSRQGVLVPYKEGGDTASPADVAGGVQQASAHTPVAEGGSHGSGGSRRDLYTRAAQLLERRMSSIRNHEESSFGGDEAWDSH